MTQFLSPRLAALVLLLAVTPAWTQVPSGRFELRGEVTTPRGKRTVEGTLTIDRTGDGFTIERMVRTPLEGRGCWRGMASIEKGTLSFSAYPSGILDRLDGRSRGQVLRASYRIEDDGSLRGEAALSVDGETVGSREVARIDTGSMSRDEYFAFLDQLPGFRRKGRREAFTALLDLLERNDVPPRVDRDYARRACSPGGGRVLLVLDYTRDTVSKPIWSQELKGGLTRVEVAKLLKPTLSHFRAVNKVEIFRGDGGYVAPFQDAHLTSPSTNQVGHLLCAVATGFRAGYYQRRPLQRWSYELGLRMAARLFGIQGVVPTIADFSRAGIIGHELLAEVRGSGFLGQMNAYGRLVANGDPEGIRAAWDRAVAAVLAGDHLTAWRAIRLIAWAGQIPETRAEMEAIRRDPSPRFARPGSKRSGNTLADLSLSVYGFALGQRAATSGFPSPSAARAEFEAVLHARGTAASAIIHAADTSRGSARFVGRPKSVSSFQRVLTVPVIFVVALYRIHSFLRWWVFGNDSRVTKSR